MGFKVKKKKQYYLKLLKIYYMKKELPHCSAMLVFHFFCCKGKNKVFKYFTCY